jgi:hypothetical protein
MTLTNNDLENRKYKEKERPPENEENGQSLNRTPNFACVRSFYITLWNQKFDTCSSRTQNLEGTLCEIPAWVFQMKAPAKYKKMEYLKRHIKNILTKYSFLLFAG